MSIKNPTRPGAGIQDDLDELGWTVTEAARRMGVRRENLSLLIHGADRHIAEDGACTGTYRHQQC